MHCSSKIISAYRVRNECKHWRIETARFEGKLNSRLITGDSQLSNWIHKLTKIGQLVLKATDPLNMLANKMFSCKGARRSVSFAKALNAK